MNVRRSAFIAAAMAALGLANPLVRTVAAQGTITAPTGVGFGYELDRDFLKQVTEREEVLT